MQIKKIVVLFLWPVALSGCYAYKIFPKNYRNYNAPEAVETVYVINPSLKKEYSILEYAGLYKLSGDSNCPKKIRLVKLSRNFVCGNGMIAWAILGGQLPVYMPDKYQYQFEEITPTETTPFKFELQVAERFWFWDMFTFQKNFKKQAGKVLAGIYNHR